MSEREQQMLNIYVGVRPTNINTSGECGVRVYRSGKGYYEDLFHISEDHTKKPVLIEWGYGGSGPHDLAFSLLADVAPIPEARQRHSAFVREVISTLPHDIDPDCDERYVEEWWLTGADILGWLDACKAA